MVADPAASQSDGLIGAYRLNGRGGVQRLTWADVDVSAFSEDLLWIHLYVTQPRARQSLAESAGIDALLAEDIDAAECRFEGDGAKVYHCEFTGLRRQTARIRRYLAPLRDGPERLSRQTGARLTNAARMSLREQADRLTRYGGDLGPVRERAMVAQEELQARLAQLRNQRVYVLSIVAAVFLPLTFITGLVGLNVAGLPGTQDPTAFNPLLSLMIAASAILVAFFK